LNILNTGNSRTFVVSNRQEVIDIFLASNDLTQEIINWKVTNEESLSDHRHIHFSLQSGRPRIVAWHNPRTTRWNSFKRTFGVVWWSHDKSEDGRGCIKDKNGRTG